jgi:hypothetical protein
MGDAAAELERALRVLLARLEDPFSPAAALRRASRRCELALAALRDGAAAPDAASVARSAALTGLVRDRAARELAQATRRLALAQAARRALASQLPEEPGGACDCAG